MHERSVAKLCWLFVTPWTVACQAHLSMGFSWQEHWSGLSFPPPRDLPNPRIKPASPALAGRFSTTDPSGKPPQKSHIYIHLWFWNFEAACCIASQLELIKVFLSLSLSLTHTHTFSTLYLLIFTRLNYLLEAQDTGLPNSFVLTDAPWLLRLQETEVF